MVVDGHTDLVTAPCIDHTLLYKSFVKTLRARSKATGNSLPSTRIFPGSTQHLNGSSDPPDEFKKKSIPPQTAHFFLKAREIQEKIDRLKQLLHDHRRGYMGQINDITSMTLEDCVYMDKVLEDNLKTVDKEIIDELESKVPISLLQSLKKSSSQARPGDPAGDVAKLSNGTESKENSSGRTNDFLSKSDVECCMAVTALIVRGKLLEFSSMFANMKQARSRKQTVKAKLMRLQRPPGVEKDSTVRLRKQQEQLAKKAASDEDSSDDVAPRSSRKKVQFEDWRADEEDSRSTSSDRCSSFKASGTSSSAAASRSSSTETLTAASAAGQDGSLKLSSSHSPETGASQSFKDRNTTSSGSQSTGSSALRATDHEDQSQGGSAGVEETLSPEECQMLEQENAQLYNELQSTHEEVRQITKQVAELGRLQDVLLDSVQEQAVVADSVQQLVMVATDNVQEGNEQIREAMRKDASFRVWIMFFLIVMSFTILFLDWYND